MKILILLVMVSSLAYADEQPVNVYTTSNGGVQKLAVDGESVDGLVRRTCALATSITQMVAMQKRFKKPTTSLQCSSFNGMAPVCNRDVTQWDQLQAQMLETGDGLGRLMQTYTAGMGKPLPGSAICGNKKMATIIPVVRSALGL